MAWQQIVMAVISALALISIGLSYRAARNPVEKLGQGLFYRIDCYYAFNTGININIDLSVTRQSKKQFLYRHLINNDSILFKLFRWLRFWYDWCLLDEWRDITFWNWPARLDMS